MFAVLGFRFPSKTDFINKFYKNDRYRTSYHTFLINSSFSNVSLLPLAHTNRVNTTEQKKKKGIVGTIKINFVIFFLIIYIRIKIDFFFFLGVDFPQVIFFHLVFPFVLPSFPINVPPRLKCFHYIEKSPFCASK